MAGVNAPLPFTNSLFSTSNTDVPLFWLSALNFDTELIFGRWTARCVRNQLRRRKRFLFEVSQHRVSDSAVRFPVFYLRSVLRVVSFCETWAPQGAEPPARITPGKHTFWNLSKQTGPGRTAVAFCYCRTLEEETQKNTISLKSFCLQLSYSVFTLSAKLVH